MDPSDAIQVLVLLALVGLSAFFSSAETALVTVNKIRIRNLIDEGDRRAITLSKLIEDQGKMLSAILIGNNIVNITATTIATVLCTNLFHELGPTVATVALTIIILIFGEVSPKSLAKESPEKFAMFAAPLLGLLMVILTPLNFLFGQWKKLLSRVFRSQGSDGITEEELVTMVDQAEDEGGLDQHESQLIRAAIEFNDLEVGEILTPRVDLVAAEEGSSEEQIASLFAQSGYSRLPIYQDTVDNIVGVIHEKDFYAARSRGRVNVAKLRARCFTPPEIRRFPSFCGFCSAVRPIWP